MGLIGSLWLFLLGVLGASNLIIAKKPDAAELIAKMAPYQGGFGAISAVWGVWFVISAVLNLGWIGVSMWSTVWWGIYLATGLVFVGLGLLLGIGVLKTFIKDPTAQAKMDETVRKLAPKQGLMGLVAIGIAIFGLVVQFVFLG
jgi:hypothetical protein